MILPIENKNMSEYTITIYLRIYIGYTIGIINNCIVIKKIILKGQRAHVLKRDRTFHNALYILQF